MKKIILMLIIMVGLTGCLSGCISDDKKANGEIGQESEVINISSIENQTLENLYAFSKVYGYVRFFHPSKEGHNLDWDRFAVYGVSQIKNAKDDTELKEQLEEIFLPIAPKIKISFEPNLEYQYSLKDDYDDLYAWQHDGVDVNGRLSRLGFKSWKNNSGVKIFEAFPEVNELIQEPISDELYVYIPLALYKSDARPDGNYSKEYKELKLLLNQIDAKSFSANEQDVRLADIIITWNVLQHFFPYFDVLDVKWEEQLIPYLERALVEQTPEEFKEVLNELLVKLEDGHAKARYENTKSKKTLPVRFDLIESQVVVSNSETSLINPGDIILSIDGIDALEVLQEKENLISGSPHYKQYKALRYLAMGFEGDNSILEIEGQNGSKDVELAYDHDDIVDMNYRPNNFDDIVDMYNRPNNFDEIEEGIYYINYNINDFTTEVFEEHLDELIKAKGIIFDNRGYPWYNFRAIGDIAPYLFDGDIQQPIIRSMQTIHPDRQKYDYDNPTNKTSVKEEAIIKGQLIFLIDASAISGAEIVPAIVNYNDFGLLVGQPTAGANGVRNEFTIPGDYTIYFTGLRVEHPDGSQFHAKGIQPDYYVERTMEGVTEGRDEFIEKAIEIINNPK